MKTRRKVKKIVVSLEFMGESVIWDCVITETTTGNEPGSKEYWIIKHEDPKKKINAVFDREDLFILSVVHQNFKKLNKILQEFL